VPPTLCVDVAAKPSSAVASCVYEPVLIGGSVQPCESIASLDTFTNAAVWSASICVIALCGT
jgi:hypothetical protein